MLKIAIASGMVLLAHDAPSGWTYPSGCCNDGDCKPIACDSITETKEGYDWNGLHFEESRSAPLATGAATSASAKSGSLV